MKFISQGTQYAISAIIAISKQPSDIISAAELARSLNCPAAYLSQILAKLKTPGILKSQRGLRGGVYLTKELKDISIYEIVAAIDGEIFFNSCFMGIEGCGNIQPCPFHNFWATERDKIKNWLQETSFENVDDLMTQAWFEQHLSFVTGLNKK